MTKANAKTTAKKLLYEVICRFGVPETIESDRGTHFTGQIMQIVCKDLAIEQAYHAPISSGKVEKYSGIIKERLAKLMQEREEGSVKKQWPELLPLVLYNIRITPTYRSENLSPYEILFSGPT